VVEPVAEAIPKNTYLHDPHVTKEAPTEDTAAAVIHVVGIVETGTAETEITIEETGTAIEEIEEIVVSIVDEATEADITTVAATEGASVVEEGGDSEEVIEEVIGEDGTEVLDIVVVGLRAMLPPVDLQEISLSTHQPVLRGEEEVDTKTNTVVVRTMSLLVVVLVWDHLLDLSLLPQDKNILNNEVDTTIDDDTRTEVEVPNEITIEVMAGNGVIAMEMIDEVVIVESTRMEGAGVTKTIAVQNDGGIKIAKVLGKSGE
jgi:hypothetical protein